MVLKKSKLFFTYYHNSFKNYKSFDKFYITFDQSFRTFDDIDQLINIKKKKVKSRQQINN